jgi:lipopolysaccharide export system protein LptA
MTEGWYHWEVCVVAKGFRLIAPVALVALMGLAGPAAAQEKGPFGGFKHDSGAPIEVVSDSLEVRQAENLAIFTGEVVAAQDTMRLTADKLTVIYAAVDSGTEASADTETEADSGTGKIQHMRADGNVFVANGDETAQGAWAEYDVANGMIHMGGDVILTQGANAVSGQSLVIDLNTGNGKVEGGRVKSVFAPADKN